MTQKNVVRIKTAKSSWNREHFTIGSADGILGARVFSAAAWPRMIEEATLTVRTNKMASVIATLKLAPAAEDTGQNTFLARFSLILKLTPLSILTGRGRIYRNLRVNSKKVNVVALSRRHDSGTNDSETLFLDLLAVWCVCDQ